MKIISVLKFITSHPLNCNHKIKAVSRFMKWQLNTMLNPYPIIYPFTKKSKLIIKRGMTGATGNLYCGLHEYNEMLFLLHFLRKEDTFADIGANIGSYTILAAGHVGAKTFSFEPIPSTFSNLLDNIAVNRLESNVMAFNIALGSQRRTINFTSSLDTMNHVASEDEGNIIVVSMETFDDVLENHQVPALLKIDVEGFETEVLIGMNSVLKNKDLKAIIIELNGSGKRYGYDEKKIHKMLSELDFNPFMYTPTERLLTQVNILGMQNTIYIRDVDYVRSRIESADKIEIFDSKI